MQADAECVLDRDGLSIFSDQKSTEYDYELYNFTLKDKLSSHTLQTLLQIYR